MNEFCYLNNPKSLFRKYAQLVTWFANQGIGRDFLSFRNMAVPRNIALMLPNGFVEGSDGDYRMTVFPCAPYSSKLYPVLQKLDMVQQWIKDFKEAQLFLAWNLGLIKKIPSVNVMFTESTFNPDANPESTSVDGSVERASVDATWAAARETADGTSATPSSASCYLMSERQSVGGVYNCYRIFTLFDSSALTAKAIISAGVYSIHWSAGEGSFGAGLIQTNPASNTNLVTGDFDALTLDSPDEGATRISAGGWSAGFNNMVMNATGRGWISLTGITKLGLRADRDIDDTTPPNEPRQYCSIGMADGANDPRLVVTYTLPAGGIPMFMDGIGMG